MYKVAKVRLGKVSFIEPLFIIIIKKNTYNNYCWIAAVNIMMYRKYINVAPHNNNIFTFLKLFISGAIIVGKKAFGQKCFGLLGKIPFGKKFIREKRRVPF